MLDAKDNLNIVDGKSQGRLRGNFEFKDKQDPSQYLSNSVQDVNIWCYKMLTLYSLTHIRCFIVTQPLRALYVHAKMT